MIQAKQRFATYLKRRYGDRSTPKHYLNDLDMFKQIVGSKNPQAVTRQDIDQFIDEQKRRGLKASTINRRLASLHTFFEYIASEDGNEALPNPVHWQRHRLQSGQSLPRDASDADVETLFAVIDDARDQAIFGLMVGAGLRVGEVVSLLCTNVYPPGTAEGSARLLVCGKGQKERMVWVTPGWYQTLKAWQRVRPESESEHLFLNQHKRPMSVSGVQYRLKQYCQQANVHFTCHQLRHTFARRLAEQQMPIESIAQLLGHDNVTTTQLYTAGANPQLRDEFLAAMTAIEQLPVPEPDWTWSIPPHGKRQEEPIDTSILTKVLAYFDELPPWLQPVLQTYFKRCWAGWQAHTAKTTAPILARHLLNIWQWLVAERNLSGWEDLRRVDVEVWLAARQATGLKPSTIRRELSLVKSCIREAMTQNMVVSANLLRAKSPACPQPLPRFLSPDEMRRLELVVQETTAAETMTAKLERAWFLTLSHTGVRCAELLNLRLSDLDFSSQRLFVPGGKNGDERIIYLTPTLIAAIASYLTWRPATNDDHLWITATGNRLARHQVKYRLQRWGGKCDVHVTPHRLRHTFATRLVNQGLPLTTVAKLLGHRSLNMTQHYARLYEHTVRDQFTGAMEQIEGIAAIDWPQRAIPLESSEPFVEHTCDSV
ncbi:MAG: tyrosine-type recombinase/integrase [Chloroflexi bacterium]|nr:tyrosine-type recombinase/integrase [Chloroflexota bacterium]